MNRININRTGILENFREDKKNRGLTVSEHLLTTSQQKFFSSKHAYRSRGRLMHTTIPLEKDDLATKRNIRKSGRKF